MIVISCSECRGLGVLMVEGRLRIQCDVCNGSGDEPCCECDDGTPATAFRCVDCTPPLSQPLCARHAAEYAAEELV